VELQYSQLVDLSWQSPGLVDFQLFSERRWILLPFFMEQQLWSLLKWLFHESPWLNDQYPALCSWLLSSFVKLQLMSQRTPLLLIDHNL